MADFIGEIYRVINDKTYSTALKVSILFTNLAAIVMVIGIIILIVLSALIRDTAFIQKNPFYFSFEMFLMGLAGLVPFLFLYWSRTGSIQMSGIYATLLLTLKFSAIHLLMSTSGAYTYLFGGV